MEKGGGILLIDKPAGITSFGVVARVRKALGVKKIGHAGTLDPAATGLLILGIDEGTKKLAEYLKLPKTYDATIRLGIRTETSDLDGRRIEERAVDPISIARARDVIEGLRGTSRLPVSAYSALKRAGEPLYKKARRGEIVTLPLRDMEVHGAEFLGMEPTDISVGSGQVQRGYDLHARFDVGSGTYIRSLAEDVGKRLGVPATLASLRRTKIGDFRIEDAVRLAAFGSTEN